MRDRKPLRRILFAATGFHVGGGIASVNRCIARALDQEVEARRLEPVHTVSLNDDPSGPGPSPRGVHMHARSSQARFALETWRAARRLDPDLVLFDHAGLARVMQLPLPGLRSRDYAIFAHGTELRVIASGLRRRAFEGARIVLTNSRFTAEYVRDSFPSLADRVHPVLLCVDPDLIAEWEGGPPPEPAQRAPSILIVGRMWSSERGKGHDALLAALPLVRARVPDAELWVVGEGDDVSRLEALAREHGVGEAVRFLGGVSNEELGRLYRTAGVFAMPSRQEGFGLVYAEAMWHGLPCIGSTRDAARDVITEGETGFLVPYDAIEPLADAIVRVLSDPEAAGRMGRDAASDARRRFGYERFRTDLLAAIGLEPRPPEMEADEETRRRPAQPEPEC